MKALEQKLRVEKRRVRVLKARVRASSVPRGGQQQAHLSHLQKHATVALKEKEHTIQSLKLKIAKLRMKFKFCTQHPPPARPSSERLHSPPPPLPLPATQPNQAWKLNVVLHKLGELEKKMQEWKTSVTEQGALCCFSVRR